MEEVATQRRTKCNKIWGWIKQIYYIYCWIMTIIFAKYGTYEERIDYYWHESVSIRYHIGLLIIFLISISLMGLIYFINFIWLCVWPNRVLTLLSNINENNLINNIINNLLKEKPEVIINCLSYHMETRSNTYTDANGRTQTTYTTVMVPTYSESQNLNIFSYLDISGIFRLKDTTKRYIQLELGKEINFNDEITLYDIETIKNDLYTRNRYKDVYISISVNRIIPSYKEFYLVRLTNEENCFIQKWIYIIFIILTLDKFYELYLDCICSNQFFVIKKIVSSRQNVLENPKYSQFISGYHINEENITLERNTIGGVDNEIEVNLPTEQEIQLAKNYNKYIPQYIMKEDGEVINMNTTSIENLMEIKEENKQVMHNETNIQYQNNEINTNCNSNDINQPLITNNFIELKNK